MLVVDGTRYKPWTPKDEENEFHPLIKANSKQIFGKDTIYFDVKTTLKSASGIGSIPDAYVIDLSEPYQWYVVENELATHPVYDHIVKQLTKFINGIDNQNSRAQILELLYEEINRDDTLRATVLAKTNTIDLYRFLSKLFSKTPKIIVIIDEKTPEVFEACQALRYSPEIIEFKTFENEDNSGKYAHLFLPIYSAKNLGEVQEPIKVVFNSRPFTPRIQVNTNLNSIYEKIERAMFDIDPKIKANQTKQYRSFKVKRIFAYIQFAKRRMNIVVMIPYENSNSLINKHFIKQLPQRSQKFWGGPCFQVSVDNEDNLEEIIDTLEEAYKLQLC